MIRVTVNGSVRTMSFHPAPETICRKSLAEFPAGPSADSIGFRIHPLSDEVPPGPTLPSDAWCPSGDRDKKEPQLPADSDRKSSRIFPAQTSLPGSRRFFSEVVRLLASSSRPVKVLALGVSPRPIRSVPYFGRSASPLLCVGHAARPAHCKP